MKGKIKKLVVIALVTTMLLGSTLTAHADHFYFLPNNMCCINSACGYAPLRQGVAGIWYCPGCGWTYDSIGRPR